MSKIYQPYTESSMADYESYKKSLKRLKRLLIFLIILFIGVMTYTLLTNGG